MLHYQLICNLIYQHAALIDSGEFGAIGSLMREASIIQEDGTIIARGESEISDFYTKTTRIYPCGTPRSHHIVTNPIIEFDNDESLAISKSRFTVLQQTDSLPLQAIITGHYHDTFSFSGNKWAFRTRTMIPTLLGDLSEHLLFNLRG